MNINQDLSLSVNELLHIQNEIFDKIKSSEQDLLIIQKSSTSLIEKWQNLLQVLLPIQLDVIKNYGFGEGQLGLTQFNETYALCTAESTPLLELNKQKWLFIFEKAFKITEFKEISLQEAQRLIDDIVEEMISEVFLKKVDKIINSLPNEASLIEKRKAILTVLFPLHLSIMAKHGFEGKTGYIQAQRAIMDYYYDPMIVQRAAYAQSVFFERAQLVLP